MANDLFRLTSILVPNDRNPRQIQVALRPDSAELAH
jgi:hypothetical protein